MRDGQVKNVIFGAGQVGHCALSLLSDVAFFVDNDISKAGSEIEGIRVRSFEEAATDLKECRVIIAVSQKHVPEIKAQLDATGVMNCITFQQAWQQKVKAEIEGRKDFIGVYNNALKWIDENTLIEPEGKSIICNTELRKGYPEVSGYYIPTLLRLGRRDTAKEYARWLISIQKEDGSWYDTDDESPYVFDTGQILKGLLAVRRIWDNEEEIDAAIRRGCEWMLGQMQDDGRLITPNESAVGDGHFCSEAVHLYCLTPLIEASKLFSEPRYAMTAQKIKTYYLEHFRADIMEWHILTHFYAYIMEALLDLGEEELVREAMSKVATRQNDDGTVPGLPDVHWTCSTGLFQLALVWFRLGELERGNRAFEAACNLQNKSGGWYGSYVLDLKWGEDNDYFPTSEISWAVKYFFDALYNKNIAEFNAWSSHFLDSIDKEDGRYVLLLKNVLGKQKEAGRCIKVLDVGCGKGRYLKNLLADAPQNCYYGVDISTNVMRLIHDKRIQLAQGTLTDIPHEDETFDVVFTCEALEHAIDIDGAIRELARVTKKGGLIIVIDKSKSALGEMEITPWEQWFDERELQGIMLKYCSSVEVHTDVPYEDVKDSNLFSGWIGKV